MSIKKVQVQKGNRLKGVHLVWLIGSLTLTASLAFGDSISPGPVPAQSVSQIKTHPKSIKTIASHGIKTQGKKSLAYNKNQKKNHRQVKKSSVAMQVVEPTNRLSSNASSASRARHDAQTADLNHSRAVGLTPDQKVAFGASKDKMQTMMSLITLKRQALLAAKPEDRAVIARELHSLILEKEPISASPVSTISTTARTSKAAGK